MKHPVRQIAVALLSLPLVYCGGQPAPAQAPEGAPSGAATSAPVEASAPGADAPADSGGARFVFKVPQPGDVREDHQTMTLTADITASRGQKSETVATKEDNVQRKRIVALASSDKAITKKKVSYIDLTKRKSQGPQEMIQRSPLTGKTYIVELKDGKPVFSRDDGTKLSELETTELRDKNKSFGKGNQLSQLLPDHELKPGEKIAITPEQLRGAFGPEDGIKSVDLQFVGLVGEGANRAGKFRIAMTIEDDKDGLRTLIPLQGHVTLQTETAWPLEVAMEGPVTIEGTDSQGTVIKGVGKMRMAVKHTYSRE